jgi:hydroxymethylpyrimidine pyrophosphatase-like HAD family hydrolase
MTDRESPLSARSLDAAKTTLQETGEVYLWTGTTLAQALEIVGELGIDPSTVALSATVLKVKRRK